MPWARMTIVMLMQAGCGYDSVMMMVVMMTMRRIADGYGDCADDDGGEEDG